MLIVRSRVWVLGVQNIAVRLYMRGGSCTWLRDSAILGSETSRAPGSP